MTAIRSIVFDLGKVLLDWNPRYLMEEILPEQDRLDYFMAHVCTLDWIEEVDLGKPLSVAVEERKRLFPDYAEVLDIYGQRWTDTIPKAVDGMVELKQELLDLGYTQYSITNFGTDTFVEAAQIFPFIEEFEGMVISGHEGIKKPDPRIFQILLDRYDLDPSTLLFIDDRADNAEAARQAGYHAVQFTGTEQLRRDLRELSILPSSKNLKLDIK